MAHPGALQRFTGIWQGPAPIEKDWIAELFGDHIDHYVYDCRHEIVLDNCILFDAFCASYDPAYYAQFKGKNAFLVHFLDENYEGSYDIYQNFRGVLRAHWSDAFNPQRVHRFPLGYLTGLARRDSIQPASQRRYVWSFLGQMDKSTRPDMAAALAKVIPNFCFATDDVRGFTFYNRHQDGSSRRFPRDQYSSFLYESSFAPSPMGNVNLDSFRVYEALECGAIPITEKRSRLDYFTDLLGKHPLPSVRSWSQARGLVADLVRNPARMDALQTECIEWWSSYKATYIAELGDWLRTQPPSDSPQAAPAMLPHYNKPGWQIREMLRHHDLPALRRRVERQAKRLLGGKGLRAAYRPGHSDFHP